MIIPAFKKAISEGVECTVFGDGTQVRDFIHVTDLTRIIGLAIEAKELPAELNLASGEATSLLDLIENLKFLHPEMLNPVFQEERAGDIHTSLADISLLTSKFEVGEMISIQEGLS